MIAEAAYYKAEKRAFTPGNELGDWLEAKREIIRMVYGDKPIGKQSNASQTQRYIITKRRSGIALFLQLQIGRLVRYPHVV